MSKKSLYIIIIILASLLLLGAGYYIYARMSSDNPSKASQDDSPFKDLPPYVVPDLTKDYSNSNHGFSLKIPADFNVRESTLGGTDTIVFENEKTEGIQAVISPYEDKTVKILTSDMIRSDIPDMDIRDVQEVEIGREHKGVAFKSDNEAFSGSSREVWFIFQGELYQISTYERFDGLLQKIFGTWKFE